jgi:hypothetical protein
MRNRKTLHTHLNSAVFVFIGETLHPGEPMDHGMKFGHKWRGAVQVDESNPAETRSLLKRPVSQPLSL